LPNAIREVFVISDLHLGGVYGGRPGDRGFRINTHVGELIHFIHYLLGKHTNGGWIELVINGDLVDFLAEREPNDPPWVPFTPDQGESSRKLEAIAERDSKFFDALGEFLRQGHRLTILLGNHDIELALPQTRKTLERLLGVAGIHDFHLITNGEAYAVGNAIIEHGNRYDRFNVVDYDGLRRLCSLLSRRQDIPRQFAFDPPAGSKMVSWVMNPIKKDYRFIDLLKPETGAVIPILLALEPGYRRRLAKVAQLSFQASRHSLEAGALPSFAGDIKANGIAIGSLGDDIAPVSQGEVVGFRTGKADHVLEEVLLNSLGSDTNTFLQWFGTVDTSVDDFGDEISALEVVKRSTGLTRLLLSRDTPRVGERLPALLIALRALQNDQAFDPQVETSSEYVDAARDLVKRGFRYVIFGHTHLAKRHPLGNDAFYLNSGTWADLMRLPEGIFSSSNEIALAALKQFITGIEVGDLSRWINFRPTYVRIDLSVDEKVTYADVYSYPGESPLVAV
jgi:UDP-2,3-diacylglucosamine pyrophosphatase LpxH